MGDTLDTYIRQKGKVAARMEFSQSASEAAFTFVKSNEI